MSQRRSPQTLAQLMRWPNRWKFFQYLRTFTQFTSSYAHCKWSSSIFSWVFSRWLTMCLFLEGPECERVGPLAFLYECFNNGTGKSFEMRKKDARWNVSRIALAFLRNRRWKVLVEGIRSLQFSASFCLQRYVQTDSYTVNNSMFWVGV